MDKTHLQVDDGDGNRLDAIFLDAKELEPDDRLRLVAKLWASLPRDHWAAPNDAELSLIRRQVADFDKDGLGEVPWRIIRQMAGSDCESLPEPNVFSAPRRFDLATIFVVTIAYSLLFAFMSVFGAHPGVSASVGGFITAVGIGQALLFGGKNPRVASLLTGIAAFFVGTLIVPLVGRFDIGDFVEQIAFALIFSIPFGSALGYLAGVMVGGVFLVADAIRRRFPQRSMQEGAVETSPFDDLEMSGVSTDASSVLSRGDSSVTNSSA